MSDETTEFRPDLTHMGMRATTTEGGSMECFVGLDDDLCFFFVSKTGLQTPLRLTNKGAMGVFAALYALYDEGRFAKIEDALLNKDAVRKEKHISPALKRYAVGVARLDCPATAQKIVTHTICAVDEENAKMIVRWNCGDAVEILEVREEA